MKFRYEGHDKIGRPRKGEVEAASIEAASQALRADGLFLLNLEESNEADQKTVLDHDGDVESEIEFIKTEAEKEDAKDEGMTPLQEEVIKALEFSKEVFDVLRERGCIDAYAREVSEVALKEMIAEAAVRHFRSSGTP